MDVQILPTRAAIDAILKNGDTPPQRVSALIDTGASGSVIQEPIAKSLGLAPIGKVRINTPSSHNHPCYTYAVMVLLPKPEGGAVHPVRVDLTAIAAPLQGQNIQCLLGRDFLESGMLVYNGPQESFYFSI